MGNKLYKELSSFVDARLTSIKRNNSVWVKAHTAYIRGLVKEYMPSGSGFDNGTHIDLDASKPERLKFFTSFHHMTEHGFYDGWTEHIVVVRPSLQFDFILRVSGQNRDGVKDGIYEIFNQSLLTEVK